MMNRMIVFGALVFAASPMHAANSPEQQAREFVFSLHDHGDTERALEGLFKGSAGFTAHPDRIRGTTGAIDSVLKDFGPIEFTRFLKKDDLAPVLTRIFLVSDTAKGPVFWCATFYRKDPKSEDWSIASIRVSGSVDDIIK